VSCFSNEVLVEPGFSKGVGEHLHYML